MPSIPFPQSRGASRDALDAFIAACLAPLPADAEQPSAPIYVTELKRDAEEVWRAQYERTLYAYHLYIAAGFARQMAAREGRDASDQMERARKAYVEALGHQMQLPAPSVGALRWKEERRKLGGARPEWEAAIAADVERLAPILAKVAARKPRKASNRTGAP